MEFDVSIGTKKSVVRFGAGCGIAIAMVIVLGGCQQEMSRTDKGYSIPSFSSASSRSGSSTGSNQNKGATPTTRSSGSSGSTQKKGSSAGGF